MHSPDIENIRYLANFWSHMVGHTVTINDLSTKISHIDESDPNQIRVEGSDDWWFIQDMTWNPSVSEAYDNIQAFFGMTSLPDGSLRMGKRFIPHPTSYQELVDVVISLRLNHSSPFF